MSKTGVKFRELNLENTGELGFVFKSWIGSFQNHAGPIPRDMYRTLYQGLLDRIVRRPGCVVLLAVNPANPDQLFGFAVAERDTPTLHYIYVKGGASALRRKGVGSDLLEALGHTGPVAEFHYTHSTKLGREFLNKRGGRYKPRLIDDLP